MRLSPPPVGLQDKLGFPRVCDLFSCLKLDGDNQKWLHHAPIQVRASAIYETGNLNSNVLVEKGILFL